MISFFRRWPTLIRSHYINSVDRRRALGLLGLTAAVLVAWLVASYDLVILPFTEGIIPGPEGTIPVAITPFLLALTLYLVFSGNLQRAIWLFVSMAIAIALISAQPNLYNTWAMIFIWPVIVAGVLLDRRGLLIVTGIIVLGITLAALNQTQLAAFEMIPAETVVDDFIIFAIMLFITVPVLYIFSSSTDQIAKDMLIANQHLEQIVTFRDSLGTAESENDVMIHITNLLTEQFGYAFIQAHLTDTEGRLFSYTRTGLGTRHTATRAELDVENAIRVASRTQTLVMISANDLYEKRSHLLPSVNHAVAMPLMVGDQCIGVLDIQSNAEEPPFNDSELRFLKLAAIEMAQALTQVRTITGLQQVLDEQQVLGERMQTEMTGLRRQADESLGGVWMQYFQGRRQQAFGFDVSGRDMNLTAATDLPPQLMSAMQRGEIVVESGEQEQIINLPITRRGQVLGAMSFGVPGDQPLSNRQIEMARSVANRLSVALENARLVEQSQAQAARERAAGEVSSALLGQQEVSALLDTAAESFQEALGAIYTRIYIEPDALREEPS